jgi:hypothetical protein
MTSELNLRTYLALTIYVQIIALLAGGLFVLALAGRLWILAAAAAFLFFLLTVPPAVALHTHKLRASNSGKLPE